MRNLLELELAEDAKITDSAARQPNFGMTKIYLRHYYSVDSTLDSTPTRERRQQSSHKNSKGLPITPDTLR